MELRRGSGALKVSEGVVRIERGARPAAPRHGPCRSHGKAGSGVGRSQPLRLVVDRRIHAEELTRFEGLVVRGPGADDCAIWVGPIGADS